MEYKRINFRFRPGLVVLLFLLPLFSLGAIEAEWKDQIVENQRFTLKFITTFHGGTSVDIVDPVWPDGITKVSGPYTAQRTIQKEDNTFATVLQVIYTLRGNKVGIFLIPPVSISDGKEVQTSKSLTVPILRRDESFLYYPLLLDWASLPDTLYVGQAYPLILVMKNLEKISLPELISLQTPEASILENVAGLGDIQYSSIGDKNLYYVPMDTWMLTPSKAGSLQLGSAKVKILGLTRKTESHLIKILPLPERVSATGAVGDFKYSLNIPDPKGVVGEPVSLSLRVEGTGNLNYLVLPEPQFPESMSVVRKENSNFSPDPGGFTGFRELEFSLIPKKQGNFDISIPGFIWLNPDTGDVVQTPGKNINLKITSLIDSLKDDGNRKFQLFPPDLVLKGRGYSLYRNPFLYLFLLPGLIFLIFMKSGGIRRFSLISILMASIMLTGATLVSSDGSEVLKKAEKHFEQGEFSEALNLYTGSLPGEKRNAYFFYNKGILQYLNHQKAEALSSLRSAMYLKPSNLQISSTLESIEKTLGLEHQFSLSVLVSPDILFILFLISVNIICILISLPSVRQKSGVVIFILLMVFTGLLSGAELIRTSWILRRSEGVIRQDVSIRKIPDEKGSPWISLPEGTSVEIVKDYQGFILVSTAYGLEGWIPSHEIIRLFRGKDDEV